MTNKSKKSNIKSHTDKHEETSAAPSGNSGNDAERTILPQAAKPQTKDAPACVTKSDGKTQDDGPDKKTSAPKSAKRDSTKNAIKHGIYSQALLLPWESEFDFCDLYDSYVKEWNPNGPTEEAVVFDLVYLQWLKLRALKSAHLTYYRDPYSISLKESGMKSWDDILTHQETSAVGAQDLALAASTLLSTMRALFECIRNQRYLTDAADGKIGQAELHQLSGMVRNAVEQFEKSIAPLIKELCATSQKLTTRFDQAYQPETIEQHAKLIGLLDARIDKAIRRLIMVKEYKHLARARGDLPSVAGPSLSPPANEHSEILHDTSDSRGVRRQS